MRNWRERSVAAQPRRSVLACRMVSMAGFAELVCSAPVSSKTDGVVMKPEPVNSSYSSENQNVGRSARLRCAVRTGRHSCP